MKCYSYLLIVCILAFNCKNQEKKEVVESQPSFEEQLENILAGSVWINLNYEANITTAVVLDINNNLQVTSYRGANLNNVLIDLKGYWSIENGIIRGRYIDNLNTEISWTLNNEITEITNDKGVVFSQSRKEIPYTINGLKEKYKESAKPVSENGKHFLEGDIQNDVTYDSEKNTILNTTTRKSGYIKGTNVILRENHSTESKIIGSFKNSGEDINILKIHINENVQVLIVQDTIFSINGLDYQLKKGKALNLINENGNYYIVSFKDKYLNEQTVKLEKEYISVSDSNKWYKVQRKNGQIGWVFGNFVSEQKPNIP